MHGSEAIDTTGLFVCALRGDDAREVAALEHLVFPAEFATPYEVFKERLLLAPEYSIGVREAATNRLVAFISGALTSSNRLDKRSLSVHDADGELFCIHSICTHPSFRRRGIAKMLFNLLLQRVQDINPRVQQISLICCGQLVPMYESWGLQCVGLSEVDLGATAWYECAVELC